MSDEPTARQTEVLQAIDAARLQGFGPSQRELCDALGLPRRYTQAVTDHLKALEKKGYVTRGPRGFARALTLTDAGRRWVRRARRTS